MGNTAEVDHQLAVIRQQALEIIPEDELRSRLSAAIRDGKPLRVKYGIDPTNPSIHIGHLVPCRLLRTFQDLGHTAVLIVGDYTAQIGDPTDRESERTALTREQVACNMERYIEQLSLVVDVAEAEVHYQSEWLSDLSLATLLPLMGRFSVAQMLAHETFRKRLDSGTRLSLHELVYPVLQATDSVEIEADVEIGGSDQRFNCMCGRDLQRARNRKPQVVVTVPLLAGTDGRKMSKSVDNHISVELPAGEVVGRVMSIDDAWLTQYTELATDWDSVKRSRFTAGLTSGDIHPKDAKLAIAHNVAEQLHGSAAADAAVAEFERVFSKRSAPREIPSVAVVLPQSAVAVLQETGLAASRSEARRLMEQGGVRIDGEQVVDVNHLIRAGKDGVLLHVG